MTLPELSSEWVTGLSFAWTGYIAILSIWIVLQKREPVATIGWILALAALPFAGFAIYYFFGPQRLRRQRRRRLRLQAGAHASADFARLYDAAEAAPPELRQMAALGEASCGIPVSSAVRVDFLSGGARTFDAIFEAVRQARHHVHLEYYIFADDKIGTALSELLIERAQAGVKVRLLIDALGGKSLGSRFMTCMTEAGVQVLLFHDMRVGRRLRPVTNYRTHRKIVVCDGRVGFTGGVNITDDEDERTRSDAYHDAHLRIEGSGVRWLQTTFLEDWIYAAGDDSAEARDVRETLESLFAKVDAGSIGVQIVSSGPDTPLEPIHRMVVAAINAATQRAWLTTPYFVPTEAALLALTSAALRGADVRLLVPRRSDSLVVTLAARSYYDDLFAAGVKVWEYEARMLHSKTLVIDDDCAIVGTANFDNRSFRLNFEVCAVVYGNVLAEALTAQFETDLKSARAVVNKGRPRFFERLGEALARVFSPLL
ncbi:MAG: cardiolipin synthase [Polaromonas sp.]|nr:cardiolipin synthase [Polaromonas sp.]